MAREEAFRIGFSAGRFLEFCPSTLRRLRTSETALVHDVFPRDEAMSLVFGTSGPASPAWPAYNNESHFSIARWPLAGGDLRPLPSSFGTARGGFRVGGSVLALVSQTGGQGTDTICTACNKPILCCSLGVHFRVKRVFASRKAWDWGRVPGITVNTEDRPWSDE